MRRGQAQAITLRHSSVINNASTGVEIFEIGEFEMSENPNPKIVRRYNSATLYTAGSFVAINGGTVAGVFTTYIYECIVTETVAHDPTTDTTHWRYSSQAQPQYSTTSNYGLGARVFDPATKHNFESLTLKNINQPLDNTPSWVQIGVAGVLAAPEIAPFLGFPGVNSSTRTYQVNETAGQTDQNGIQYIYKRINIAGTSYPSADSVNWQYLETRSGTWGLYNPELNYPLNFIVTDTNKVMWQSLRANNYNSPPSGVKAWLDVGPANKQAAVDGFSTTATKAFGKLLLRAGIPTAADAVCLTGVDADAVTIQVARDILYYPGSGFPAFDETYTKSLVNWGGFTADDDIKRRATVIFPNLAIPANCGITVTLTKADGSEVTVEQLLFLRTQNIGPIDFGANSSTVDFSNKTTDKYGTATLVPGNTRRTFKGNGKVDKSIHSKTSTILQQSHGKNYLWIGDDSYDPDWVDSLIIYGFIENLNTSIDLPTCGGFSFDIQEFI